MTRFEVRKRHGQVAVIWSSAVRIGLDERPSPMLGEGAGPVRYPDADVEWGGGCGDRLQLRADLRHGLRAQVGRIDDLAPLAGWSARRSPGGGGHHAYGR
jgi:hypothetical protein